MATLYSSPLTMLRRTTTKLPKTTQKCVCRYSRTLSGNTHSQHTDLGRESPKEQSALPRPRRQTPSSKMTVSQKRRHSTQHHHSERPPTIPCTEPMIHPTFEPTTGTFQYIVTDPSSLASVIIDPVLDFDPCTFTIRTTSADALLTLVAEKGYNVQQILETHVHADHLSAASYLQAQLSKTGKRPEIGIGKRIGEVQRLFGKRYGVAAKEYEVVFDKLFEDDKVVKVGGMEVKAIHLPGHTLDHMGYQIGSNVFCGDSLFNVDIGTARTDFPGGSAHDLWTSAQKLLSMPDETRIWTGHDYPPEGRKESVPFMTVKQHKEQNKHVMAGRSKDEFVATRSQKDAELGAPRLLHQSLQINVRGGRLPGLDEGGRRMLRMPLRLGGVDEW
ncbi:Metallo-hydrolase/oxidoreductase [Macroventuria anomochaeta]|uniref:Metallo-hydrolase/oxidoreductase n=1 Tax=Macroventuria anomochaeta TaxID=301207 RepID=A0ACB6RWK6_9PLEO|nr:Metallo-hydrolase/oxidoreductase [Macroventuria anomochaeta]KAF2625529.1 Metallo-hydrolase/oxidoreductase [Macroventuria anomochaeta]